MSGNIVSAVSQFLTPDLVAKIASASGISDGTAARKALGAAVIGVGGFLGIGEKEVAVPFSSMQITRRDNDWHLVVEGTRDALREAPAFESARSHPLPAPGTTQK